MQLQDLWIKIELMNKKAPNTRETLEEVLGTDEAELARKISTLFSKEEITKIVYLVKAYIFGGGATVVNERLLSNTGFLKKTQKEVEGVGNHPHIDMGPILGLPYDELDLNSDEVLDRIFS